MQTELIISIVSFVSGIIISQSFDNFFGRWKNRNIEHLLITSGHDLQVLKIDIPKKEWVQFIKFLDGISVTYVVLNQKQLKYYKHELGLKYYSTTIQHGN